MKEVWIIFNTHQHLIPLEHREISLNKIKKLSSSELKGILFKVYLVIGNKDVYNRVNQRLKSFAAKINLYISEENYTIRENTLQLMDKLQKYYDNEIENNSQDDQSINNEPR